MAYEDQFLDSFLNDEGEETEKTDEGEFGTEEDEMEDDMGGDI